ncbi:hypothetical protein AB0P21_24915 [Kribbella sp. NPDC056861]|uniref:hypothetical protein n=1 Tax=Kribbella sp. NPDC056861 TaxID=3154857 RepID=UPI00341A3DA9
MTTLSRRGLLAAGAAVAVSTTTHATASAATAPPAAPYSRSLPHLVEAEQLVDYLRMADPLDLSRNQYKVPADSRQTVLTWGTPGQPASYRALAQCGSFVTSTLLRGYGAGTAYGWATPEYFRQNFFPTEPAGSGKWAPTAEEFQRGFLRAAQFQHLTQVTKPVNLKPGDLVAIDYGTSSGGNTGHVVMIRQAKGLFAHAADSTLGQPVDPYLFEIIDCTSAPHGDPNGGNLANYEAYPDSRFQPTRDADGNVVQVQNGTGVGYGHMVFYGARSSGLFAGYRWSVNSSTAYRVQSRPLSAARI